MNNTYCIFSALYHPHIGGVENYTFNLARELTRLGNQVIIVTNNTEESSSHQVSSEAEIYRLPCSGAMGGRFPITKKNTEFKELWSAIEAKPIDRVIINTRFYPLSIIGAEFAEKKGLVPLVVDHGSAHLTVGNKAIDVAIQRVEHFMTDKIKKHDARYFGVSRKSIEWIKHFGIQGEGVLNNAIDASAFRERASQRNFRSEAGIGSQEFVVSFTGRLAPEKGIQHLVNAANMLDDNVHIFVAGSGVLMDELRSIAPKNVHFFGSLSPEDVSAMLLVSDAFCMPTRSEGFSTSLLEAASCGLALISTNVGGVDELIPSSEYGIVLEDARPETVSRSISLLAANRDHAKRLGENARKLVEEEFSWKKTAEKFEKSFDAR